MRRSSHVDHDVVYASVGASAASDLLRFPPAGSTAFEHSLKLGSGAERFATASSTLMTWGAQQAIGIVVDDIEHPDQEHYAGVVFDAAGVPEAVPEAEARYSSEGEPFLTAGTVATLRWPKQRAVRRVRVVYVTDVPRRSGFAIGTADSAGVVGEVSFHVEHRDDDSVWAVARGFFWAPSSGIFGLRAKGGIRIAQRDAMRQITALAPGAAINGGAATSSATKAKKGK